MKITQILNRTAAFIMVVVLSAAVLWTSSPTEVAAQQYIEVVPLYYGDPDDGPPEIKP